MEDSSLVKNARRVLHFVLQNEKQHKNAQNGQAGIVINEGAAPTFRSQCTATSTNIGCTQVDVIAIFTDSAGDGPIASLNHRYVSRQLSHQLGKVLFWEAY